jgi:prophage antirepressor-like protein
MFNLTGGFTMDKLQIFKNSKFGEIRTYIEPDGTVLFCASDVAKSLGYTNPRKAVFDHCRGVTKRYAGVQTGIKSDGTPATQTIEMSFIPEGDIYRLTARSQLPAAEKFESWIFDEVLPSIRKTGTYSIEQRPLPHDYLSALSCLVQTEQMRLEAEQKTLQLEAKIAKDEPYTVTGKTIEVAQNAIKIEEFAKVVQNTYKGLGRNKMFKLLREKKIFYSYGGNTLPLQEYMNREYFVVKETPYTQGGMTNTRPTILITGKGQVWLANKLNEWLTSSKGGDVA